MEFEKKKRLKDGDHIHENVLNIFNKLIAGEEETIVKEFVIVVQGKLHGEDTTDVLSTSGSASQVVGMLEMAKLHVFENRGD